MCGCGTCARDRNMGQRGQVVHGKTLAVEVRSQLAVSDARSYGDAAGLLVQRHLIEKLQRDLGVCAVGDPVERVARAERPQLAASLDCLLYFLDGFRK